MPPRSGLALLLALAACSNEVSPGRDAVIVRDFQCERRLELPDRIQAYFGANHMPFRRLGDARSTYLATATLDESELAIQMIGPATKVTLFVPRGRAPNPREREAFDGLTRLLARCRPERDPLG